MNHQVFLGIGSNIEPEYHVGRALDELNERLELTRISSVYRSEAIGFDGNDFLNLAVEARTNWSPGELHEKLRAIEYGYGRRPDASKFSSRQLDIDILTVDDLTGVVEGIALPRRETTENAFVLCPLAEIAPEKVLPGQRDDLATLWSRYDRSQRVFRVELRWHGEPLPQNPVAVAAPGKMNL